MVYPTSLDIDDYVILQDTDDYAFSQDSVFLANTAKIAKEDRVQIGRASCRERV